MKIINQLTSYLLNKYSTKLKYEKDIIWDNEISIIRGLFRNQTLREVLWEMVFTFDIQEPINLKQRYNIYVKMNSDPDILLLLKSRYSKNYQAYFSAKDKSEQDILKGRMLEIQNTINCMETASDRLNNWDKYEKVNEKKIVLKKDINEKILNN